MKTLLFKLQFLYAYFRTKRLKFKNRQELELWQEKQLKKLARQVFPKSPYYLPFRNQAFQAWPSIHKQQHMQNLDEINTVELKKSQIFELALNAEKSRNFNNKIKQYSIGLSSGTSANRGVFITSPSEQAFWAGALLAKTLPNLIQPQRIALFLRANNNLYKQVSSLHIKFKFFDLMRPLSELVQELEAFKPSILLAAPSVYELLIKADIKIQPKKIFSIAEVLYEDQKEKINLFFNQTVHQIYQCTEGFLAVTCNHGNLHVNEDIIYLEKQVCDTEKKYFSPVITDFRRRSQPVIRYYLDDVLQENTEPCPCGSLFTRLEKIIGRCDDIIYLYDNKNCLQAIFPDFISRAIILADENILRFQVIQNKLSNLVIKLETNCGKQTDIISRALNDLFKQMNIRSPKYCFEVLDAKVLGQKERRVISKINRQEFSCQLF